MKGKPLIVAALGSRGTGKSAWVRQHLASAKPARLAVWDLMQEHADLGMATADLGQAIRAMKGRTFAVVFTPDRDDKRRAQQFDLWCRACLCVGNLLAYVEELAFVTTAHKAPPGWREMCLLGRHERHRVSIIGTSQRPAQVDKEFMGNLDLIHCGRLASRGDAETAAELLGVRAEVVQKLPDLAWLERAAGDIEARSGQLSFAGKVAPKGRPGGAKPKAGKVTAPAEVGTFQPDAKQTAQAPETPPTT